MIHEKITITFYQGILDIQKDIIHYLYSEWFLNWEDIDFKLYNLSITKQITVTLFTEKGKVSMQNSSFYFLKHNELLHHFENKLEQRLHKK